MSRLLLREKELAACEGNYEQDFAELYEYYFPRVYNYIFARVGERDTVDDITSGVFEKIVSKLGTYKPERGKLSTWIFTIAQNMVVDYYRNGKKKAASLTDQLQEVPANLPPMDELMILDEDKKNLMKCLSVLSDRDRNIISLKFWSVLSNQEIAVVVKESSNHVGVILYRSIRRLKSLMLEQEKNN